MGSTTAWKYPKISSNEQDKLVLLIRKVAEYDDKEYRKLLIETLKEFDYKNLSKQSTKQLLGKIEGILVANRNGKAVENPKRPNKGLSKESREFAKMIDQEKPRELQPTSKDLNDFFYDVEECHHCTKEIGCKDFEQKTTNDYLNDHFVEKLSKEVIHDPVNHPSHYTTGKIEVIEYIEDQQLGYHLGNAIKYISRAGKKDPTKEIEDLKKAAWYIARRIAFIS